MKVSDLMTTTTNVCRPVDSLLDAARILWEQECGCLPVVDGDNHVVGMITDRDICMAAHEQGDDFRETRVAGSMGGHVWTVLASDEVETAVREMRIRRVRRLPVVDADGHLQGLLSLDDVARGAMETADGDTRRQLAQDVCEALAVLGERRQPNGRAEGSPADKGNARSLE